MGEQVKQALAKLKEYWVGLTPKVKKIIGFGAAAIIIFAVGSTLFLNLSGNNYVVLYPTMEAEESQEVYSLLQELDISAKLSEKGQVMVRRNDIDFATAKMALKHYPLNPLPYDIFNGGAGLTTTDYEKRVLEVQQAQNRLQDTVRQFDGVKNAIVTLNIPQESNRVWEENKQKSTGSVTVMLKPGYTLSKEQVSGIKYLVSANTGMEINDVKVIDAASNLSLNGANDDMDGMGSNLDFESQIESRLVNKALNVLSIAFHPDDVRVSATVVVDYKKMLSEKKEYLPSPDSKNNAGVLQHEDTAIDKTGTTPAAGVAGEEDNTDTPTYLNKDGTLNAEALSQADSRDYVISYITEQVNNDKATLQSASMSVTLKIPVDDVTRQSMLSSISKATNIPEESIAIENITVAPTEEKPGATDAAVPFDLKKLIIPGIAVLAILIILIVVTAMLRGKAKKRKQAALLAEQNALQEARQNMQKDLEERKRQLKENAESNSQDNAITNEVREFAQNNPEITANLLRAWLKEDSE
ncbi:MAG: flagellar M-ring protein FliF C-terminal domain-containing protein [Hydrogenoanaerobacterium sp.]